MTQSIIGFKARERRKLTAIVGSTKNLLLRVFKVIEGLERAARVRRIIVERLVDINDPFEE